MGNHAIETEEYKGYNINIMYDENPENPRNWDNLSTMLCFHRGYSLGDIDQKRENKYLITVKSKDFDNWNAVYDYLKKELKAVIILPLYLYDHSGISIKVGSYQGLLPQGHAEFDSGQVGFVYVTAEKLKAEGLTKKKGEEVIRAEVETYNNYLTGEVYGFSVVKNGENFDNCWGFYDIKDTIAEAKSNIDYLAKEEKSLQLQY